MSPDEFYHHRKADWEKLDHLLTRSQTNSRALTPDEIRTLGRLYRAATADLALAQRDFPDHRITQYLNRLAGRAHAAIYQSEPLAVRRLASYIRRGFPRAFRANGVFTLVAFLMFIIPAVAGGTSTALDPDTARYLLSPDAQALIPIIEDKELWVNIPVEERPYTSTFIMQNNIRVAFLAYGGGIPGGLLTVYVMVFNGLLLGALTGLTAFHGLAFELWTFVIGHGVIELSVIFMAGGAGLSIGWAVIHPGLLRRSVALAQAAQRSMRILIGCIPLLVIAGLIEGFISPSSLPPLAKWLTGAVTGVLLYSYLLLGGRVNRGEGGGRIND